MPWLAIAGVWLIAAGAVAWGLSRWWCHQRGLDERDRR
jgi:hypothetical protein